MAYRSLYRVYRPKTFDEVSGQPHITEILKNQVKAGKTSHAYLFCGPRGTGKTSTAKIFAKALNCENPQDGNPCLKCPVCESVKRDAFVDIVEIDAASNNGVDNVREIREKVALLPVSGRFKVYIIDEVHMLSSGAFNALLKTLEEPPPHAVFILATTEIRKVPATILSRCQRFDFKRVAGDDIISRLMYVAEQSGIAYDGGALELIARQAEGSLRDALSIMDQCVSSGVGLSADGVSEAIGIADSLTLADLTGAIISEDAGRAVTLLRNLLDEGVAAHNLLRDLISALSAELAENASNSYKCACILRSLEALIASQTNMRYTAVPSAVLLAAVARATVNTADVDTTDFELRIRKLEERVDKLAGQGNVQRTPAQAPSAKTAEPADVQSTPAQKPQPQAPAKTSAKRATQSAPKESGSVLDKLHSALKAKNMTLMPAANAIKSAYFDSASHHLSISFSEEDAFMADMFKSGIGKEPLKDVATELFGGETRISFTEENPKESTSGGNIKSDLFEIFGEENVKIIE